MVIGWTKSSEASQRWHPQHDNQTAVLAAEGTKILMSPYIPLLGIMALAAGFLAISLLLSAFVGSIWYMRRLTLPRSRERILRPLS